jgi:hypothetical protein
MGLPKLRVLVAAELGCPWPKWLGELLQGSVRRVLSQMESESPSAFTERLLGIAKRELGSKLETVVVLCNERTDAAQQGARRKLLEALVRSGARRRSQRFVIAARGESDECQRALAALSSGASNSAPRKLELRFETSKPPQSAPTQHTISRVA